MFARPATPSYPELSAILQKNIQEVLLGQTTPEDAMQSAAKAASRLR
jgi:multiple sugar transport system substrate-binding protein